MNFIKQYWPGLSLFLIFVLIGLFSYQNYGVSTDEIGQTDIGTVSYKYVFENDTTLNSFVERDHGVGFELPLIMIEKGLNLTEYRDIFLCRHIVSHLFFLICMLTGYFLSYKLFKNQLIACATFIMLVLNPRLYAHSFFNSKDMPSLAVVVLIMAATYWAFERKKPIQYLLLGIACGYAMSIRLMNIVIVAPLLFFIAIDIFSSIRNKDLLKRYIIGFILLVAGCALTLYACWPTLWAHPIDSLIESFTSFSKFRWRGDVLFSGILYNAEKLPWSYIPSWFFATVPELWLFFGLAGIIFMLAVFLKNPWPYFHNNNNRHLLLYLYGFIVPIISIVVLQSILYDDWRHLYFIYPPFILLAAYGMYELLQTKLKIVYQVLFVLQLGYIGYFINRYHPHEYIYFNHTVSHKKNNLMEKFALDYWGLTIKDGLEWILNDNTDDSIYINYTYYNNLNVLMLTEDKRKRFVQTEDESKIEYHIENFRLYPFKYPEEMACYQIFVSNSPVLRVTKLR